MSVVPEPSRPFGRRSFLRTGALAIAGIALTSPVRALASTTSESLRVLGERVRVLYPARAARLMGSSGPRTWPHLRAKHADPLLFVDGWLLPSSIAQVALQASKDG